ncbi:hypothetical protein M0802_013104 [Mischocyttarus mexicanus]|nr:hypothetical protein M0802_013104 [Mischocyttarus mexicanus]
MQLLEEYEELIERDLNQISILWKILQIFFYFLTTISGYCSAILFYIFWKDVFGGHCPLWAHTYIISTVIVINSNNDCVESETVVKNIEQDYKNWLNYIVVKYDYGKHCEWYFIVSLFSCIFGIVWIAFFSVYGKGGYSYKTIPSPWRIVPPALFFNLIFTIVTIYIAYDLEMGFKTFKFHMDKVFVELTGNSELLSDQMICNILQSYVELYNVHGYNACNLFFTLKILTWTMAFSWVAGLILLLIRILLVVDFRILKIRVYELPNNFIISSSDINKDNIKIESIKNEKKKKD